MQQQNLQQPHMQLAEMSRWYVVSRGIHTVARLGLANYMSAEPVSVNQLAKATGTDPELLNRLLKFLSAYHLFDYHGDAYSLTELSRPLRDDDPHTIRDVLCMVDDSWWQAFSCMDIGLKTGDSAFEHQHGDDFFSFLSKNTEKQRNFDLGMARLSTYDDDKVASAFDFSGYSSLVDMGGGRGGLAKAIAACNPGLAVTLFDTPAVIHQLQQKDFSPQIKLLAGDFTQEIPLANAYIFKGVLHDFSDAFMHKILSNCSKRMLDTATLLIAEQVMPADDLPHPNKTMDIVMMVLLGGRQRTLIEWQKGIEPSGFRYVESYKTDSVFTLMKFKPER